MPRWPPPCSSFRDKANRATRGDAALRKTIAIIGAGIAGVTLARRLHDHADVTILEKSRGLGGRMAERRREGFAFDHGAQYFTARDESFRAEIEKARLAGAVDLWPQILTQLPENAGDARPLEPRFIGSPGMPGLVRHMAEGLTIRRETEVKSLTRSRNGWTLAGQAGELLGEFDLVVSTAPAPQTARLMPVAFSGHAALATVRLSGCFTLMLGLDEAHTFPFDMARLNHPVLSTLSVNSSKPQRGAAPCLVIHSRNDWADRHMDADREWVTMEMLAALHTLLPRPAETVVWSDLHRWRYANVEQPAGVPHLYDRENRLAACGDWCLANRIEAAYLSAESLADVLREL